MTPAPALFLDRDGVLNERRLPFVRTPADFRWRPGVLDALARARERGFRLVVVTNQWPVGSGWAPRPAYEAVQKRLRDEAADAGAAFDRVMACEHPAGVPCDDAKPSPRMILEAAAALDVDLAASWMLGDQLKDVLAGRAAGCSTALVNAALRPGLFRARRLADVVADGVPDVVDRLLARRIVPAVRVPVAGPPDARVLPRERD